MKYKKNIFLIVLIVSSLFLILFPKSVIGSTNDIDYTFENKEYYNQDSFEYKNNYSNNYNTRNITSITEIYEASYSFTDDAIGSIPNGWNDDSGFPNEVSVIEGLDGHNKVLQYNDTAILGASTFLNIPEATNGIIEFWVRTTANNKFTQVLLWDSDANKGINIFVEYNTGKFSYHDGTFKDITTHVINTWYRIKIIFDFTSDWEIEINGIQYGSFSWVGVPVDMDVIKIHTESVETNFLSYLDGVGIDWLSNYSIGNNLIPLIETNTSIIEIDKYEFSYDSFGIQYPVGNDIFSGWIESDSNDKINSVIDTNEIWKMRIEYDLPIGVQYLSLGIEKDFDISANVFNITAEIEIDIFGVNDRTWLKVFSDSDSLLSDIYFENNQLKSNQGTPILLKDNIIVNSRYQINIYINLFDDISVLRFSNSSFSDIYIIPLITLNQNGLGIVEVKSGWNEFIAMKSYLSYIGVYVSENPLTNEFGYIDIKTIPLGLWRFMDYDLFSFSLIGNISFWLGTRTFYKEPLLDDLSYNQITPLNYYDNYKRISLYDTTVFFEAFPFILSPILYIQFYDTLELFNITIDGTRLTEGINEYELKLENSGVNLQDNYFYVDSNNKLQFIHTSDDTNLEYIQATFDITDKSTDDRGISFRGNILNKAYGYFALNFHPSGSNSFDIPFIEKTTRSLITQNRSISDFSILITDNDQDIVSGITTGYISDISLLSISGIGVSIITSSLLNMIIPLMIILIPTLLLSSKLGKKLIIPIFLVFSIIITATSQIPVWLFFIIAYGCGLFIMLNKRYDD